MLAGTVVRKTVTKDGPFISISTDKKPTGQWFYSGEVDQKALQNIDTNDKVTFTYDYKPAEKKCILKSISKINNDVEEINPLEEINLPDGNLKPRIEDYNKPETPEKTDFESELKCERCGAQLKDNKYKTCYTCSMAIRKENAKSPEEKTKQDSIKRQAIMHAVSRTLIGMQGQVNIENVCSLTTMLYAHYSKLVG